MNEFGEGAEFRAQLRRMLDGGIRPISASEVRAAAGVRRQARWPLLRKPRTALGLALATALLLAAVVISSLGGSYRAVAPAEKGHRAVTDESGSGATALVISPSPRTLELLSPSNGVLLRRVSIPPARGLPAGAAQAEISGIALPPGGQSAYVVREGAIEHFALGSDRGTVVAQGTAPAISDNGEKLAYLVGTLGPSPRVVVLDLRTGQSRSWVLAGRPHLLAWSRDDVHLAVTLRRSGAVAVLDTREGLGPANPDIYSPGVNHGGSLTYVYGFFQAPADRLSALALSVTGLGARQLLVVHLGPGNHGYAVTSTDFGSPAAAVTSSALSPSGRRLAFVAQHIECGVCQGPVGDSLDLWAPASRQVIRRGSEPGSPAAAAVAWLPMWSPGGTRR